MSSTTEDYLKRILAESHRTGEQTVGLGRLASLTEVTPGTVTSMVKRLARLGLLTYMPRRGVQLTARGQREAMRVLRRHRLIEAFLVDMLGLDWAHVHSEAEVLEHAMSDRVVDRIDDLLGHPASDPHGDPIPSSNGTMAVPASRPLSDVTATGEYLVARVEHDDPAFLDYLTRTGITPGRQIHVTARDDDAMTLHLTVGGRGVTVSFVVAGRILVEEGVRAAE